MADNPIPKPAPVDAPIGGDEVRGIERADEAGEVEFIYKLNGRPREVPIFELARMLQALGNVLQEADHIINRDKHKLVVKVKPFQEGSWIMDLTMAVQNHPEVLFFLTNPDAIKRIKDVLEYVGLIKKSKEAIKTVLDIVAFLKGQKPQAVQRQPDGTVNITGENGAQINVPGTVANLYLNPTITNNYYYAFGGNNMERQGVEGVSTFVKHDEANTKQFLPKQEVITSLKPYSEPLPVPPKKETVVNETTVFLNPKEGTYGSAEGVTFLPAGKKRGGFKARIIDENFLARFHSGQVRFYQNDVIKARVKSEQTLKNGKTSTKNEIVEVLNYEAAPIQGVTD